MNKNQDNKSKPNYNRNQVMSSLFINTRGNYDMDLYLSMRRETWDTYRSVETNKNNYKRL